MKEIESRQNEKIKLVRKLSGKKYREQYGLFAVENFKIIKDALESGYDFEKIFLTKDFWEKNKEDFKILENNSKAQDFYLISEEVNEHISQLDTSPGILAVYKIKKEKHIKNKSVVYLNGINDPGNLGSILRSSLAFGFENVVVDKFCADIYNHKTINAAKESIFKLKIIEDSDNSWLKNCALPVYATATKGEISLEELRPAREFCLVFGSESHGVDKRIMDLADKSIYIPITGRVESLNVAQAATVFLYKLAR